MTNHLTWRKSTFSTDNGACVEIATLPAEWRKSSISTDNGECVEIATLHEDLIAVRDSKHPAGHLVVSRRSLLAAVR